MPNTELWAAALSLLLRHNATGCAQSGLQAADLLDRLSDFPGVDQETRTLCEQASLNLSALPKESRQCLPNQN